MNHESCKLIFHVHCQYVCRMSLLSYIHDSRFGFLSFAYNIIERSYNIISGPSISYLASSIQ